MAHVCHCLQQRWLLPACCSTTRGALVQTAILRTFSRHGLQQSLFSAALSRRPSSSVVAAAGSFNFAESGRADTVGRKNRTQDKQKAQEVVNLVRGLCAMSPKQLQAVSHLLTEQQLKELAIALKIPPTNQGRKRQENLVAKMLRKQLDEAALAKLSTAVEMVKENSMPFADREVEQQIDVWVEGLVAGDQEILSEVQQLCQQTGLDWTAVRTWARQLQQQQRAAAAETALAAAVSEAEAAVVAGDVYQGLGGAAQLGSDQLVQQTQQQQQAQLAQAQRSSRHAQRSLRQALRPLAIQQAY